ncbi:hypothetical protein HPB52_004199 [Rhipicephalus sanguineus]|uniref:Armadillo repeat-containing protein 8 n=1 Tax=Rhipicephalus sanguineus TaxID=34632 RepID=A0A9D4QHK2_RHISA|nr:hypothetical protein HPB52_004199 [Rhipicephalus sanguineus]
MATQTHASNQECIATILTAVCKTPDHQNYLCAHGAVPALTALLCSPMYKVQLPSLRCLTHMCYQNLKVSQALVVLPVRRLDRGGAFLQALPTLVRMCKKERTPEERAHGAETLAYLAEVDTELQRIASISDHLIPTLAELLKYQPPSAVVLYKGPVPAVTMKKIIETDSLMEHVVSSLSDTNPRVRLAAVRCLHSLSRSVQQLRTTFQDHAVWRPLMRLLHNAPDDILLVASSTLCNLLLEFSPSKETQPGSMLSGCVEAASGSTSPQHEQVEASPSCWEELRLRDELATDHNFDNFVITDADAYTDTPEVLDDDEIVQLVSGAQEESEDANDTDTVKAPVPTLSQVIDAVDLLRRFAGAHKAAEDALISLASYDNCVLPMLTKRMQAKIMSFYTGQ